MTKEYEQLELWPIQSIKSGGIIPAGSRLVGTKRVNLELHILYRIEHAKTTTTS